MTAADLIAAIEAHTGQAGRRNGSNTRLLCPVHDDHHPSLDVAEGEDGRPLVVCRSQGCTFEQVLAALGLAPADLHADDGDEWTPHGPALARYAYHDEAGQLLFEVCRTAGKQFPVRRPDPAAKSGWRWNLEGTRRVLYRLPQVLAAVQQGGTVHVVEGEKDVQALERLGLVATCNPGGAGKWRPEYADTLAGAPRVVVLPDDDQPGRAHAEQVAHSLHGRVGQLQVVHLFDSSGDTHRDVADFLAEAMFDPAADLAQVVEEAPAYAPSNHDPVPVPDPVPTPSPGDPVPVPDPYRGDGVVHPVLGHDPVPDPVPSSWVPVDIVARAVHPPERPQIIGLFYPGLNHVVSGLTEALKTWLLAIAAAVELAAGHGVVWVDGDDVGSAVLLERLRLLGVDDEAISERFAYIVPDEPLGDHVAAVLEVVRARACRLAVLDGFNPLLALHDFDPNVGTDVEAFYRLIDPIRKTGAAVVLTDNVVKAKEARGAWAIGSERKKSKAEVHLGMKALVPFVRGGSGKARIEVHKDRPGYLTRPSPGVLVLDSVGDGCTWRIDPDTSHGDEGEFRPTTLMERVSRHLEIAGEPVSQTQVEENVTGKARALRTAIDRLVSEGYVAEFEGPRQARMLRLERPFREAEDAEAERLAALAREMEDGA